MGSGNLFKRTWQPFIEYLDRASIHPESFKFSFHYILFLLVLIIIIIIAVLIMFPFSISYQCVGNGFVR